MIHLMRMLFCFQKKNIFTIKHKRNQSKYHFLLHKNESLHNFYIMTLVAAPRSPAFFNLRPTKNVMLQQMSRPNMLEHFLIEGSCLITNVFFILVFTLCL